MVFRKSRAFWRLPKTWKSQAWPASSMAITNPELFKTETEPSHSLPNLWLTEMAIIAQAGTTDTKLQTGTKMILSIVILRCLYGCHIIGFLANTDFNPWRTFFWLYPFISLRWFHGLVCGYYFLSLPFSLHSWYLGFFLEMNEVLWVTSNHLRERSSWAHLQFLLLSFQTLHQM